MAPLTASAVVVEGLFEVEMPVLDESKEIRRAAQDDGLVEVLVRVSGDSHILEKIEAPAANSYVQQFEYLVQPSIEIGGAPTQLLWVRYNATRILDFLRKQAIPIWGERRSQVVIWLAVRDGNQRYILKNGDTSLIKSKADAAFSRRGMPVIWPQNDAIDQQLVRFADVWAGFADPLNQASKRYSSGPVIAANMGWNGSEWEGEWSLLLDDEVHKWSLHGLDYVGLISTATDLIADIMGQKYAVLETFDVTQLTTISVEIDQVKNVENYRRINKYLMSLSAVQSVRLSQVEPNRVFFDLALRSKVDDLLNQIKSGSILALLAADNVDRESEQKSQGELKDEQIITDTPENITTNTTASDVALLPVKTVIYRFALQ
ncbi:MAG: DUF2066 domain-containing protein [Gammaproteobacteria bacterium]|nr:DUF2066 domain-containing protein [Gammaproteobacteria bacterium]